MKRNSFLDDTYDTMMLLLQTNANHAQILDQHSANVSHSHISNTTFYVMLEYLPSICRFVAPFPFGFCMYIVHTIQTWINSKDFSSKATSTASPDFESTGPNRTEPSQTELNSMGLSWKCVTRRMLAHLFYYFVWAACFWWRGQAFAFRIFPEQQRYFSSLFPCTLHMAWNGRIQSSWTRFRIQINKQIYTHECINLYLL